MSERKQVRNPVFVACVIIAVLCFCTALIVAPQTTTYEHLSFDNDSVMTAEGVFDRVELVDRHFGDYNGQEVEGSVLAVLYENGSIEISSDHYEARPNYENDTNYPFFLYIYDGIDHLRERISVEGGTPEEFIFLNVTITASLSKIATTRTVEMWRLAEAFCLFVVGMFFVFAASMTPSKRWINI